MTTISPTAEQHAPSPQSRSTGTPPSPADYAHLRASNWMGAGYLMLGTTASGLAIYFSTWDNLLVWAVSQVVLAFAMVQSFALLHEAGHRTLFKSPRLNTFAGHLASLLAGIPFENWKAVHRIHHRWTGWQDLDVTTAALVPRKLSWLERTVVNTCWAFSVPLFSILYRWQNYWNMPRLFRLLPQARFRLLWNSLALLGVYVFIGWWIGWPQLLQVFGAATVLSLMMQDVLILSQHTHIPMQLSEGEKVRPFPPAEQEVFTRSLRFPAWFSVLVLVRMDAHELHHLYPSIPGYRLGDIDYETHNAVCWRRWLWNAKRVSGEVFLMQNRNQSGFDI